MRCVFFKIQKMYIHLRYAKPLYCKNSFLTISQFCYHKAYTHCENGIDNSLAEQQTSVAIGEESRNDQRARLPGSNNVTSTLSWKLVL